MFGDLRSLVRRKPGGRVQPAGDRLLEFLDPEEWQALLRDPAVDLDRVEDVLLAAMTVWNACVLRALNPSAELESLRALAQDMPAFVARYTARKERLFADDLRCYLDVRPSWTPGGGVQVDALACALGPEPGAAGSPTLAPLVRRAPRKLTRTERDPERRRRR